MTKHELSTSRLSQVIVLHTYIQTDIHTPRTTLPRRFAGVNKNRTPKTQD